MNGAPRPKVAPRRSAAQARASRHAPEALRAVAELGYDYYLDGRIEEARVVFEGLLAVAPRDPFALRAYAETCLLAGDHAAALRAANGLIAVSTNDAGAYLLRGRVLLVAGRHEDASADLSRAARLGDALAADLLRDLVR